MHDDDVESERTNFIPNHMLLIASSLFASLPIDHQEWAS